ncbi:hypothetical protein DRH27_04775, partial [Candidatus Falkowbacteria bacterium]
MDQENNMKNNNLDIKNSEAETSTAPAGNKKGLIGLAFIVLAVSGVIYYFWPKIKFWGNVDDWVYNAPAINYNEIFSELELNLFIGVFAGLLAVAILMMIAGRILAKSAGESKAKQVAGKILKAIGGIILFVYLFIIGFAAYTFLFFWTIYKYIKSIDFDIEQLIFYYLGTLVCLAILFLALGIIRYTRKRRQDNKIRFIKSFITLGILLFLVSGGGFAILKYSGSVGLRSSGSVNLGTGYATNLGLSGSGPSLGASLKSIGTAYESAPMVSDNLGFAVGGAKDVNNFRENIANNYLPIPTDITYEGLFYDYYFDTGQTEECKKLFCPSYTYAVTRDPYSEKQDYYLSVGLNSGIKESDFKRKKLNLVIVLDISGSMGSSFNQYYYDSFGSRQAIDREDEDAGKSKMEIAAKSVVALLDNLEKEDRFGMVLFESQAYLAKPLNLVGNIDMQAIKDHILEINDRGGTQMSAGMKLGTEQFDEYLDIDKNEYENRIIFLTDAMPNLGDTGEEGLFGITERNADNDIYSTFIGIGVDFNTELVEAITKIRGANYYSVHSASEFKARMDDEFELMVTPLVFDLKLVLDASGYEIEKVYGSPEADEATGQIMKVNTLFPSRTVAGETRGG